MDFGTYIKFIDDGTLTKNIVELTLMAENDVISNNSMHKICKVMLDQYWECAVKRWKRFLELEG